jgi:cold shock CspA family protein
MGEKFGKREKENLKQQKKQEKEERKSERRSNAKSGSLEHMMAYVDENGNISSNPPDPNKKNVFNENDIIIGSRNTGRSDANQTRKGHVSYFSTSKGYGFITDAQSQESIFVHAKALITPVNESDIVSFQIGRGVKGNVAIDVQKIYSTKLK